MVTDLKMLHEKLSDFVSFPLFGFTLGEILILKVIRIIFKFFFFDKIMSDLIMYCQTVSDLV